MRFNPPPNWRPPPRGWQTTPGGPTRLGLLRRQDGNYGSKTRRRANDRHLRTLPTSISSLKSMIITSRLFEDRGYGVLAFRQRDLRVRGVAGDLLPHHRCCRRDPP